MDNSKWLDVSKIVCIKKYKTLNVGSHYDVKGSGNLEFNADPNVEGRKGFGLCVEDPLTRSNITYTSVKNPPMWYYFTIRELDEYFITDEEAYKIYLRDEKINYILNI